MLIFFFLYLRNVKRFLFFAHNFFAWSQNMQKSETQTSNKFIVAQLNDQKEQLKE